MAAIDAIASLHPTPKAWLVDSSLAPHLDAFVAYVNQGRYAVNTNKHDVAGIAHFARWMTQCDFAVQLLDEHAVEQFLRRSRLGDEGPRTHSARRS